MRSNDCDFPSSVGDGRCDTNDEGPVVTEHRQPEFTDKHQTSGKF